MTEISATPDNDLDDVAGKYSGPSTKNPDDGSITEERAMMTTITLVAAVAKDLRKCIQKQYDDLAKNPDDEESGKYSCPSTQKLDDGSITKEPANDDDNHSGGGGQRLEEMDTGIQKQYDDLEGKKQLPLPFFSLAFFFLPPVVLLLLLLLLFLFFFVIRIVCYSSWRFDVLRALEEPDELRCNTLSFRRHGRLKVDNKKKQDLRVALQHLLEAEAAKKHVVVRRSD
jgi:hypothetical protein